MRYRPGTTPRPSPRPSLCRHPTLSSGESTVGGTPSGSGPLGATPAVVSTSFTWPVPEQRVDLMGNSIALGGRGGRRDAPRRGSLAHLVVEESADGGAVRIEICPRRRFSRSWRCWARGHSSSSAWQRPARRCSSRRAPSGGLAITWAVLAFAVATADGTPNSLYLVALALGLGAAALYLAPSTKAAFAEAEATATPPTPIAFSLTMIAVLFGVSAAYGGGPSASSGPGGGDELDRGVHRRGRHRHQVRVRPVDLGCRVRAGVHRIQEDRKRQCRRAPTHRWRLSACCPCG